MPVPLIVWGGVAVATLLVGGGGYAATRDIGKGIEKTLPLAVAGSLLVYAITQSKK